MFLCAVEISRVRRSSKGFGGLHPVGFNDGTDFAGYECPLNASPYVD
jgi:hypothetical protein